MTKIDNSDRIGPSDGTPDGNPHTLRRRPLDREHSLSGVITRLVGLQYVADRERQIDDPKRMPPLDAVPDIKKWLIDGALTGFIRSDDGAVFEIVPGAWDDVKIEASLAGRVIQALAQLSNVIVEVPGTSEPAVSWDELAKFSQFSDQDLPGDEMVLMATANGFTDHGQIITGKPFFRDRDIERVLGYGWTLFNASADMGMAPEPVPQAAPAQVPGITQAEPEKRKRGRPESISGPWKDALFATLVDKGYENIKDARHLEKLTENRLIEARNGGKDEKNKGLIPESATTRRKGADEVWAKYAHGAKITGI